MSNICILISRRLNNFTLPTRASTYAIKTTLAHTHCAHARTCMHLRSARTACTFARIPLREGKHMRKRELEIARKGWQTGISADKLRQQVQKDLEVVKSAHDVADQILTKIEMLLHSVQNEKAPTRALRDLAAAAKDAASVVVSARVEARASIAARAAGSASADERAAHSPAIPESTASHADPPAKV